MDGPLNTIYPIGSHMHLTFCRIYRRNWRKYLPVKICCPSLPWRRRSAMPLMNIMRFVTSSKDVIRLSISTSLRESSGSTLAQAVGYALNEYNAICDIFKRGDTALDNNYIERIQRYISLSRRNSMFFGSHEGASRESRGTYHYQEETLCSLVRTKEQAGRLSYILSQSHAG